MAHYAEIDNNNKVTRVLVVANEVTHATPDGTEDESLGATFLHNLLGGEWVQTSYNGNKRGLYAGIGYTYDRVNDVFVAPQVEGTPDGSTEAPGLQGSSN